MNTDIAQNNILKSNTSLVGLICKDGVVLAGDRRVTAGSLLVNKDYLKLLPINDSIIVAYTGSVSDAQLTHKIITAELRLKELKTKTKPTVKEAAHLLASMTYRNIRSMASIVGSLIAGLDQQGSAQLFSIEPGGSVLEVKDFDANFSSGMPYIVGFLERMYKKDLSIKEGIELAKECIKSSTQRDTGSGNGIDVFTITKDGIKHVVAEEIVPEYR